MAAGHAEAGIDQALPFVLVALLFGVVCKHVRKFLPAYLNPPYTVILFLFGFAITALSDNVSLGRITRSIDMWLGVHPHVILLGFLPPLLFESAFDMDYNVFQRIAGQALLLALPGVVLSLCLTAVYIWAFFGEYNWGWDMCFLLGSILSATDPVAVVAVLKTLGAPARLASLVEGESLLNDGSAFVFFLVFKEIAAGKAPTAAEAIGTFCQLSLGGPLFGLVCAWIAYVCLFFVYNDAHVEVTGVIVAVFGVFMLSELSLAVSSVLAVVVFGLFFAKQGKYALSIEVHHTSHGIWSEIGYVSNTLVFTLSGVVFFKEVFKSGLYSDPWNWFLLAVSYVMLHVVRVICIAVLYPIMKNMGYGLSYKECAILAFGGLRGAVGLSLGLLVELEDNISLRDKHLLNFHVAGIVFLTLLLNGTLAGAFYNWVKPYPSVSEFKVRLVEKALEVLEVEVAEETESLKHRWYFRDTRWPLVDAIVPTFTDIKLEHGHIHYKMGSVGECFKKDRVVTLWGAGIANARLKLRSQEIPKSQLMGDAMVSGMVDTVMSALGTPKGADSLVSPSMRALGVSGVRETNSPSPPPVFSPPPAPMKATIKEQPSAEEVKAGGAEVEAGGAETKEGASKSPKGRLGRRPSATMATEAPGLAVLQASKRTRGGLKPPGDDDVEAAINRSTSIKKPEDGELSMHAIRSLKTFNVHKRDEVCQIIFATVKAHYHAMYEDRYLDSAAMLVLIDSLDKGNESVLLTHDTEATAKPIRKAWNVIKEEVATYKWPTSWATKLTTRFSWTRAIRAMFQYTHVQRAQEALHAYIEAHSSILDGDDYRSALDPVVTEAIRETVTDAMQVLNDLRQNNVVEATVLGAVMAAKVVLNGMRGKIMHLYHEEGMLDEGVKTELVDLVEARLFELHSFFPSPFVLGMRRGGARNTSHQIRVRPASHSPDMMRVAFAVGDPTAKTGARAGRGNRGHGKH